MPELTRHHRRFLLLEQGIGSGVFNFVLNGAIAWLLFRSLEQVPLWGDQSIAGDTLGTTFLLPFFTCLFVTRLVQRRMRSGKLPPLSWRRAEHPTLGRLPRGTFPRALVLGFATLVVLAPPSLGLFRWIGIDHLGLWGFVAFKATFAALLAALLTPLIALAAMGDGPRPGPR